MVGFHTEDYCMNFIDCCQRILGCRVDKTQMIVYNTMCRKELGLNSSQCSQMDGVYIKALPIGIPYQRFETLSKTANRVFPNCCKVILGVDRLDYTKGNFGLFSLTSNIGKDILRNSLKFFAYKIVSNHYCRISCSISSIRSTV